MSDAAATRLTGTSVRRVEDQRILTGRGRYADDLRIPGCLEAAFVRSSIPHARITSVDVERARAIPGVVAVLTATDIGRVVSPLQGPPLGDFVPESFPVLAIDRVRFVGDPVAVVIAEDRYVAEDARDSVEIEYDPLPLVGTMDDALDPDLPPLFDEVGSNVVYREHRDFGDPGHAFANAGRVLTDTFRGHRVTHVPMEGRAGIADFDPSSGALTYHAGTQAPHGLRRHLSKRLGIGLDKVRVLTTDVGGAFGQKVMPCREDFAAAAASKVLGRPVRWSDDRIENLATAGHARDDRLTISIHYDDDGTLVGLDVDMTIDSGAYPYVSVPRAVFGWMARTLMPAPYRIRHLRWKLTVVATNKASYAAYRGPWASEAMVRESMIDRVARDLGIEPAAVRRQNLLTPEEQPLNLITGPTLEGASSLQSIERALELVDLEAFRRDQEQARGAGRVLGIGFATYIEPAPGPPDWFPALGIKGYGGERATAWLEGDGRLTVATPQAPNGQGHETTLAQVAATEFGVPFEQVRVLHGDTSVTPFGLMGTGGSRAAMMATGAVLHATRAVKEHALDLAADMLEIAPTDLEIKDGLVMPLGVPSRAITLAELGERAWLAPPEGVEPGLRSASRFTEFRGGGWSGGTHVCVVDVHVETGQVEILRYLVVEDCGLMINPAIVEGQIRGGVAQGIGIALYEAAVYDEDGNFVTGTFMDYLVPTAMEIPTIEIDHLENEPLHEVDYRGVGEGGTIAAVPAVMNAVADALGGIPISELPLTPERVLELAASLATR